MALTPLIQFTNLELVGKKWGYEFSVNGPLLVFKRPSKEDWKIERIRITPNTDYASIEYTISDEEHQTRVHVEGRMQRLAEQKENDRQLEEILKDPKNHKWERIYKPLK